MTIAKIALPMVAPTDLMRLTADVVIPISEFSELFWTAVMMTPMKHPRPKPRMNRDMT